MHPCQALEGENAGVRGGAAEALGRIGDARAVKPLCRTLNDEHPYVRGQSANALGRLGRREAV